MGSYIEGWWDCEDLEELFARLCHLDPPFWERLRSYIHNMTNRQLPSLSGYVAKFHYDLGNDFFESFLDKDMQYTCLYWREPGTGRPAKDLEVDFEEAAFFKLELIAKKLKLKPGMKVLELGSGWGALAKHLTENYGVEMVCYCNSEQMVLHTREVTKGLPVEVHLADYREATGLYDRVVSIGMFEHVGFKNYKTFFEVADRCLKDDGLLLLHSMALHDSLHGFPKYLSWERYLDTYYFPGYWMPTDTDFVVASKGIFILEDLHNFGADYRPTLLGWWENFQKNWHKVQDKYDSKLYRVYKVFFLMCVGSFRARSLLQGVYSKAGVPGGYEAVR
ncbi:unnamed protein product [Cyprideis torosa]|uniref:Uncharacterized protein n=1 Tax=Cyprideis torosa TaxID=163714 RepID=A0A7R8WAL9_9CRUS|nr:unnamed protein product [Cyprideis torosa]CAG0888535.1 unnamed protein product [Cyprideis torosa]